MSEKQISKTMLRFLLGEDALDGVQFGEKHPQHKGRFWWRQFLRREIHKAPATEAMSDEEYYNNLDSLRQESDERLCDETRSPAPDCDSSGEADSTSETPILYSGMAPETIRLNLRKSTYQISNHKKLRIAAADYIDQLERELAQAIKERDEARDEIKEMHSADSWMSASFLVDKQKAEQQLATAIKERDEARSKANMAGRKWDEAQQQLATATEALEDIADRDCYTLEGHKELAKTTLDAIKRENRGD